VLPCLGDIGIQIHSPAFLGKGEKQLPTTVANTSRLVTKLRWAVETLKGRLKTWEYHGNVVPNKDLPNIWDYIIIIAALCNRYRPPLRTSLQTDCVVGRKMVECASLVNEVQERIMSENKIKRRAKSWDGVLMDSKKAVPDFAVLSEEEFRPMTFVVCEVAQAGSYMCNVSPSTEVLVLQ